jgi:hypothetical protein
MATPYCQTGTQVPEVTNIVATSIATGERPVGWMNYPSTPIRLYELESPKDKAAREWFQAEAWRRIQAAVRRSRKPATR